MSTILESKDEPVGHHRLDEVLWSFLTKDPLFQELAELKKKVISSEYLG